MLFEAGDDSIPRNHVPGSHRLEYFLRLLQMTPFRVHADERVMHLDLIKHLVFLDHRMDRLADANFFARRACADDDRVRRIGWRQLRCAEHGTEQKEALIVVAMKGVGGDNGVPRRDVGLLGQGNFVEHVAGFPQEAIGGVHRHEGSAHASLRSEAGADGLGMELLAEAAVGEGGAGFEEAAQRKLVGGPSGRQEFPEELERLGELPTHGFMKDEGGGGGGN